MERANVEQIQFLWGDLFPATPPTATATINPSPCSGRLKYP